MGDEEKKFLEWESQRPRQYKWKDNMGLAKYLGKIKELTCRYLCMYTHAHVKIYACI